MSRETRPALQQAGEGGQQAGEYVHGGGAGLRAERLDSEQWRMFMCTTIRGG
jgi:hypothetical protein